MAKERMPFELQRPDPDTGVTNTTEIDHGNGANKKSLSVVIDTLATKTEQIQALSIKIINGKRYLEISASGSTPTPEPQSTTSMCGTALCGYAICGTY